MLKNVEEFKMRGRLPIVILAGSDLRAGPVPQGLKRENMLTGYKGAHRLPWGHCLAGELVERVKESDRFEEPILVGPRRVYEGKVDCQIVDAEGNLMTTLQSAIEYIQNRFSFSSPVAFFTCDILPTPDEIRRLLETCYAPYQECMFWWQMVEARPEELGISAWKQSYQIRPDVGQPPKNLYPGHLVIARLNGLRIGLANRILGLMYRYRARNIHKRHFRMTARALGTLVAEDFHDLLSLKASLLAVSIPYYGISRYYRLRNGALTLPDLESAVAEAFVRREFRHAAHDRPVVFATTRILSFGKDIDTKAELAEVMRVPCASG